MASTSQQSQPKSRKICFDLLDKGFCTYGSECKFSHDVLCPIGIACCTNSTGMTWEEGKANFRLTDTCSDYKTHQRWLKAHTVRKLRD